MAGFEYPDISHYRPVADWGAVARAWRVIMCKASQGTGHKDSFWPKFVREARRHKMITGAYHFLTKDSAKQQAQFFIDVLNGTGGWQDLWFMLDIEDYNGKRPSMAQANAFLDELSRLTGRPRSTFVSYLPRWWWNDHGGGSTVLKDTIYCNSDYNTHPNVGAYAGKKPEILQHTSNYYADGKGIPSVWDHGQKFGIDMNRVPWTVEEFRKRVGLAGEDISIVDEKTEKYLDKQFKAIAGRVDRAVLRVGGRENQIYSAHASDDYKNLIMAKEALAEAKAAKEAAQQAADGLAQIKSHLGIR
jgi:Glycosyl hydrolases family 25